MSKLAKLTIDGYGDMEEGLDEHELLGIRNRWTARSAHGGTSPEQIAEQLAEAQRDIAKLLRALKAFTGPPVLEK